jgi:signal transduction histidine kinase
MTALLVVWAGLGSSLAGLAVLRLRRQASLVARAAHEARGGLCVARLALDAGRPAAVELQLDRARRAVEELERAAALGDELLDLRALLRSVAAGFAGVRVALPLRPVWVRGDAAALAQACTNLVVNAIEHGAPPVSIVAGVGGGWARVEVRDAGPGMAAPPDLRPHAGRRGHGLAVAARVAARHGGRLGTAPVARGSAVVLELPAADPDGAPASRPATPEPAA